MRISSPLSLNLLPATYRARRPLLAARSPRSVSPRAFITDFLMLFRGTDRGEGLNCKNWRPEPAAPLPAGQNRPLRCRATGPQEPARNFLREFFFRNVSAAPLPGGQVRTGGVYSCKFSNRKYIFVKNKNKKYKNKKPREVNSRGSSGTMGPAHLSSWSSSSALPSTPSPTTCSCWRAPASRKALNLVPPHSISINLTFLRR